MEINYKVTLTRLSSFIFNQHIQCWNVVLKMRTAMAIEITFHPEDNTRETLHKKWEILSH